MSLVKHSVTHTLFQPASTAVHASTYQHFAHVVDRPAPVVLPIFCNLHTRIVGCHRLGAVIEVRRSRLTVVHSWCAGVLYC